MIIKGWYAAQFTLPPAISTESGGGAFAWTVSTTRAMTGYLVFSCGSEERACSRRRASPWSVPERAPSWCMFLCTLYYQEGIIKIVSSKTKRQYAGERSFKSFPSKQQQQRPVLYGCFHSVFV